MFYGQDFLAFVIAAMRADAVWSYRFSAIGALGKGRGLQVVMGPSHVSSGLGGFFLWLWHFN